MSLSAYQRNALATGAVLVLLAPVVGPGAIWCLHSMYTSPSHWAPPAHPERLEYEWFTRAFEREDAVVAAWPGCTVDDPRLKKLEDALGAIMQEQQTGDRPPLFERVITGRSMLERLTNRPIDLARDAAAARLRGIVIGADGHASCAVIVLTDEGARQRKAAIEIIRREAAAAGVPQDDLRLAGDSVIGATIDQESLQTLNRFLLPSSLVSLLLCWWRLRSWRYTLAVIAAASFGQAASLAVIYYTGMNMNAILIVMPPLIFVQVVSSGVHLVNYYLDEVRLHGPDGAPQRALAIGWAPCWMCTVTTAIGMGSLLVSDIDPVRVFGVLSALGLTATVAILFLLLPGVLERWPFHSPYEKQRAARTAEATAGGNESSEDADELSPLTHHFQRWERFADYVTHHGRLIVTVCSLAMVLAAVGLTRITTSVDVRALFESKSRILRDSEWLETWIGPLTPVEAVVRFDADCPLSDLERLTAVDEIQHRISELEFVGGVMSPLTFAPPGLLRPPAGAFSSTRHRAALKSALRRFEEAKFLVTEDGRQSWRVSARVRVDKQADYEGYLRRIDAAAAPVLDRLRTEDRAPGVSLMLTGVIPLTHQVHKTLLADLYRSFLTAFALVGVAMAVTLRGVAAGLLAMLPNVFPAVVIFGLLGWSGVALDIGTIMTASIALGIAVDDTLHFLTWYRRETWEGASREDAIRKTFRHCGRAMVQSSLITGLGLLVFSLSGFLPTKRFAWMIMFLLLTALVGDLLFLPALLMSRVGKVFLATGQRPR